jgi:hypothetical protein
VVAKELNPARLGRCPDDCVWFAISNMIKCDDRSENEGE